MKEHSYPTPAEMDRIIEGAHALRAQTMQNGLRSIGRAFLAVPHAVANLFQRVSHS